MYKEIYFQWMSSFVLLIGLTEGLYLNSTICAELRDNLGNTLSNFTYCAIHNSRPVKLCDNCINQYIEVLNTYNNLKEASDNTTKCMEYFVNNDRLEVLESLTTASFNLWSQAKCSDCFSTINGTLTPIKSKQTELFEEKLDVLMSCLNRSDINSTTLCSTCIDKYIEMDNYYVSISNVNEPVAACMDIVDVMNNTRRFWSEKCCHFRKHNEYYFIACTVMVLLVTVFFYIAVLWCSVKHSPTILQQTRFAKSLTSLDQ